MILFINVIELKNIHWNYHVSEVNSRFDFFHQIFTYSSVSKKLTSVSYTTRRALSSGTLRFSIVQSMV